MKSGGEKKTKSVRTEEHLSSTSYKSSISQSARISKIRRNTGPSSGNIGRQSVQWRSSSRGYKVPKYQNSFWLDPYFPFPFEVSDKILCEMMTDKFKDTKYSPQESVNVCQTLSADILDRLYRTKYDRVKYVVTITVIENKQQSLHCSNGRLWDAQRDTYSVFVFENTSFFAIGLVAVLYYE